VGSGAVVTGWSRMALPCYCRAVGVDTRIGGCIDGSPEGIPTGRGRVSRSGPRPLLSPDMCSGREAALGRLLLPLGWSAAYRPTGFAIVLPSALTIVSGSRWRGNCVGAILKWPSVHALNALFDRYGGKKQ